MSDGPSPVDPVRARLSAIQASRQRVLAELSEVTRKQGAWHRVDEWSLQEVAEHLVLAERGGFALIWEAAEAYRSGEPVWSGESANRGETIEAIVDRTWKAREEAPPSAEPSGFGSLSLWTTELEACDALLHELVPHLAGLPLERVIYPHFLCGPLDALQRLDFIRFHLDHHLPQIRRLKEAQNIAHSPSGSA